MAKEKISEKWERIQENKQQEQQQQENNPHQTNGTMGQDQFNDLYNSYLKYMSEEQTPKTTLKKNAGKTRYDVKYENKNGVDTFNTTLNNNKNKLKNTKKTNADKLLNK